MTGVVSCRVYLVSEMTYNVLTGTLNSTIPYLVGAGERKYNDSDHQVSDGQRHNELVGRHATQFAVSEDGHDDHHVADDDDQVETDERSHRHDERSCVQPV